MRVSRTQRLSPAELDTVRTTLTANARRGLGQTEGDDLFLRSFSTLVLSVVAAADLKRSFLDQAQFDGLVDLALDELAQEREGMGPCHRALRRSAEVPESQHATAACAARTDRGRRRSRTGSRALRRTIRLSGAMHSIQPGTSRCAPSPCPERALGRPRG